MKEIPLTKGYVAIIDDDDYDRVSVFKWSAMVSKRKTIADIAYAYRRTDWDNARRVWRGHIYLHRFILGNPHGLEIDHIDGNGLNCVRGNLRIATRGQNMANTRRNVGSLGFRGVTISKGYIIAQIRGRMIGSFKTAEEAARAYDAEAHKRYGEFAILNFPDERCPAAPKQSANW